MFVSAHPNPPSTSPKSASAASLATWDFVYKSLSTGSVRISPIIKNPAHTSIYSQGTPWKIHALPVTISIPTNATSFHSLGSKANWLPHSTAAMVPVGELNASSSRGAPQLTGENPSSWTGLGVKEECIVQATISLGLLFARFDGMIFGAGPLQMKAVLRQVTNGDNLNIS